MSTAYRHACCQRERELCLSVLFILTICQKSVFIQAQSLLPQDAMCLPVRVVNGVASPFDFSIVGPFERIASDFNFIPIENIDVKTIAVGFTPGDRQLYSATIPTHRYHTVIPCPFIWHSTPWKNPQEPAMDSTISISDYPPFATAGTPSSAITPVYIGDAFRPGPTTTRAALAALYDATAGQLWNRAEGWAGSGAETDSAADYCAWFGVECSGEDVVALDLEANNLAGTLPRAFFYYLPALRRLNLAGNRLVGNVPHDVTLCTQLAEARAPLRALRLRVRRSPLSENSESAAARQARRSPVWAAPLPRLAPPAPSVYCPERRAPHLAVALTPPPRLPPGLPHGRSTCPTTGWGRCCQICPAAEGW